VSRALQLAFIGAGTCLLAGAFAVPALYVPGATLVLVALTASACVSAAARRARVGLDLSARRIEEGDHLTVTARVTGGFAAGCRGVLEPMPGATPARLGWRSREATQQVRPVRRGRLTFGPARARWADPFQICVCERESGTGEVLVLPRVRAVRPGDLARILALPDNRPALSSGLDPDGLRPYRPGAPASRIHWLTVARTGIPVERGFREDASHLPITIALDAANAASAEALDAAVRAAASLCFSLADAGGCSVMLPGARRVEAVAPGLAGWPRLHALLALVEPGPSPCWELARELRRVVLVQAGPPRVPAGVSISCTVSPLPDAGRASLFSVSGCAVQPAAHAHVESAA
jgi:uncharacterized protein (DUF58 family)